MSEILPDVATLQAITCAHEQGHLSTYTAARKAVQLGYMLIGTAVSQALHEPQDKTHTYYDFSIEAWVAHQPKMPWLRATTVARAAKLCGLWGTPSEPPGQRLRLGDTRLPRGELFGWYISGKSEENTGVYGTPVLVQATRKLGTTLKGAIDIVAPTDFYNGGCSNDEDTPLFQLEPGHYFSTTPHPRLASLCVTGNDLPADTGFLLPDGTHVVNTMEKYNEHTK